ncbi:hypothetical protein HJC23_001596 [Cyclotella cryptica]|uniref:Large ribosomal subunit protein bL12 C-terminal domain-containing protein n=1 Tax=Cyclotella cryptica TaxID=29204 RepID=A0ABD3NZ82_9STRA
MSCTRKLVAPSKSFLTAFHRHHHRSITTCHGLPRTTTHNNSNNPLASNNARHATVSSTKCHPSRRGYVSSFPAHNAATTTTTNDNDGDDDPCPEWQNPLHHNNPEFQKIMAEDFEPGEEMPAVPLPPFSSPDGGGVDAPPHIHDLADQIIHLNMMELKSLMDRIGDHFGFEEDGGTGGEGAAAAVVAEVEKTTWDLRLAGFDAKAKIKVIKEIRAVTGLGLKEAKELVEGAPTVVKKGIKKEEAEELKAKLEEVGATIEIA